MTGIDDATAIATGGELAGIELQSRGHSCALHESGTVSCWGHNASGQLGNGSSDSSKVPVAVKDIADATAIATGGLHSCALHESGTISCWGHNASGQLGNGQIIQNSENSTSDTPVQVVGITDAISITAGFDHSCALHEDGTISCWGNNNNGQLEADTADTFDISSVPLQIEGIDDATEIAAGVAFSCALHDGGNISCWGSNDLNQLGSDTADRYSAPVPVPDIDDAEAITSGSQHSCALHEDGTISCWGKNNDGQLGNGATSETPLPVQVSFISDATAITTGTKHSCALLRDGTISCWGSNGNGQLGDGTNNNYAVPVAVIGFPPARAEETATTALARTTTTAIAETAAAPTTELTPTTATAQAAPTTTTTTSTTSTTTTTTTTTSAPTTTTTTTTTEPPPTTAAPTTSPPPPPSTAAPPPPTAAAQTAPPPSTAPPPTQPPTTAPPPPTTLPPNRATAIAAGQDHSCALHQDGTISCWGNNLYGQLGNGQGESGVISLSPVQVLSITDATAITKGTYHSCALHRRGTISCWGRGTDGQLGDGNSASSVIPVQVMSISDATAIAAGSNHSCALHRDGTISCWGGNWSGRLGNGQSGENADSPVPVQVTGITDATAINISGHSCALHQDGTISCWGSNASGQLGNGQATGYGQFSSLPVQVTGITDATAIATGPNHSCALHQDGTISCWGGDALGNGQNAVSPVPVQVFGITDATAIAADNGHSCALHRDGTISCWGNNFWGQLGNGQSGRNAGLVSHSLVPVKVTGITDATAITTGGGLEGYTCALHRGGTISCWGNNKYGKLGDGTTRNSSTPVRVTGFGG